jgi:hypothetical protein
MSPSIPLGCTRNPTRLRRGCEARSTYKSPRARQETRLDIKAAAARLGADGAVRAERRTRRRPLESATGNRLRDAVVAHDLARAPAGTAWRRRDVTSD